MHVLWPCLHPHNSISNVVVSEDLKSETVLQTATRRKHTWNHCGRSKDLNSTYHGTYVFQIAFSREKMSKTVTPTCTCHLWCTWERCFFFYFFSLFLLLSSHRLFSLLFRLLSSLFLCLRSVSVSSLFLCLLSRSLCLSPCDVALVLSLVWCVCVCWERRGDRGVRSKRPRVYRQHVDLCFNMCARCRYTRGRFGPTQGGLQRATPHRTHTQHATSHGDRDRERQREEKTKEERISRQEKRREKMKNMREDVFFWPGPPTPVPPAPVRPPLDPRIFLLFFPLSPKFRLFFVFSLCLSVSGGLLVELWPRFKVMADHCAKPWSPPVKPPPVGPHSPPGPPTHSHLHTPSSPSSSLPPPSGPPPPLQALLSTPPPLFLPHKSGQ